MCVAFLVPPKADHAPSLTRGNPQKMLEEQLAGPYLENVSENFTCSIQNIVPGKDSTSFLFYFGDNLRLQSETGTGKVVEVNHGDGNKSVEWRFSTLFKRSDNSGQFWCSVNWKAGQYSRIGLKSKVTDNTKVTCK